MDKLINLNVYGSTCHMRLWADKLVVMQSDADFKKLVQLVVDNSNPRWNDSDKAMLIAIKEALNERKAEVEKFSPHLMRKCDIAASKRQIERRIKACAAIMEKKDLTDLWEGIA